MGLKGLLGVGLALALGACSDEGEGEGSGGSGGNNQSEAGAQGEAGGGTLGQGGVGLEAGGDAGATTAGSSGALSEGGAGGAGSGQGEAGEAGQGVAGDSGAGGQGDVAAHFQWGARPGRAIGGYTTVTAIAALSDGGSYMSGYFTGSVTFGSFTLTSAANSSDGFLVRFDAEGSPLWAKAVGGTGRDQIKAIAALAGGGVVVVGSCEDEVDFEGVAPPAHGGLDTFVAAYGADGSRLWVDRPGHVSHEEPTAVSVLDDGTVYVAGTYYVATHFGDFTVESPQFQYSTEASFLAKYENDGSVAWLVDATHATDASSPLSLAAHTDGSIYVAGRFAGTGTWGDTSLVSAGEDDVFLAKLDADGEPLWAVREGTVYSDYATDISLLADGTAYLSGVLDADLGGGTSLIAKYSSAGTRAWAYQPPMYSNGHQALAIAAAEDGTSYVAGRFAGVATQFGAFQVKSRHYCCEDFDSFLLKLDQNGSPTWAGNLPVEYGDPIQATELMQGVELLRDGTAYTTGRAPSCNLPAVETSLQPIYLIKSDSGGACDQGVQAGADWYTQLSVQALAALPDGTSFVTGLFSGEADFGATRLTSHDSGEAFLAKLDPSGTLLWAEPATSKYGVSGGAVAALPDGSLYVTGNFSVAKLKPNRELDWKVQANGYQSVVKSIVTLDDGSLLVVGTTQEDVLVIAGKSLPRKSTGIDLLLARFDVDGKLAWITREGFGTSTLEPAAISALPDGSSYVAGRFFGRTALGDLPEFGENVDSFSGFLAKFDAGGHAVWVAEQFSDSVGSSAENRAVAALSDGTALITGQFTGNLHLDSKTLLPPQGFDWFVAKYDGTHCSWALPASGLYATGTAIAALPDGAAYVLGTNYTNGGHRSVFGATYSNDLFAGQDDFLLTKFTADGAIAGLSLLSTPYATFGPIAALPDQSLLLAGNLTQSVTLGNTTFTNYGTREAFVTKHPALP